MLTEGLDPRRLQVGVGTSGLQTQKDTNFTKAMAPPKGRTGSEAKSDFIRRDTGCSGDSGSHVLPAVSQHLRGGEQEVFPAHLAVVGPLQGWCLALRGRSSLLRPCGEKGWPQLPPNPGACELAGSLPAECAVALWQM